MNANDQTLPSPPSGNDATRFSVPNGDGGQLSLDLKHGNFSVKGTHAWGGMGAILAAKDLNLGRTVAMKVVLRDRQVSQEKLLRFVEEAKVTGQLEHPNIVPVHELATDERGEPYYIMKFVQGFTLKNVLTELKAGKAETAARYTLAHLLTIFQKVCDAVAFAHSKGVVHRDLKPENIMIGEYGEVLVMDWGLAKVIGGQGAGARSQESAVLSPESVGLTLEGTIMGTPNFMAPEQAEGRIANIDARTDVYALGGILYNILTLHPPLESATVEEALAKVRSGAIASPVSPTTPMPHCPNGIPDSLSAVAMKALALRREDRYPSVPELQREIEAYQGGFATAAEQASVWKQFKLFIHRNQAVSVTVGVSLLLLCLVVTGFLVRVTAERNRAEQALADLRGTAPTFYDQSRTLTGAQNLSEALAKIDVATALDGTVAAFHAQRGNILQSLLRFEEASASYRSALALQPHLPAAAKNLALSLKLHEALAQKGQLSWDHYAELHAALVEQQRTGEALALASRFKVSLQDQQAVWRMRIKEWLQADDRLTLRPDGFPALDLDDLPVANLEPLRGIPLKGLSVSRTKVRDFSPLAGMPLERLGARGMGLRDLSSLRGLPLKELDLVGNRELTDLTPLHGMPLESLVLSFTPVSDLTPLRGMPLKKLWLDRTRVGDLTPLTGMKLEGLAAGDRIALRDISALRGMPLNRVSFVDSVMLIDIRPLADCRELERIVLPPKAKDIEFLRQLPKLKFISYRSETRIGVWDFRTTAEQFWEEYDRKKQQP
jgi:serine/threonine protein kinase